MSATQIVVNNHNVSHSNINSFILWRYLQITKIVSIFLVTNRIILLFTDGNNGGFDQSMTGGSGVTAESKPEVS